MITPKKTWIRDLKSACVWALIISFTMTGVFALRDGNLPLPENPLEGSRVFFDKGCINCHKVWEMGQTFGPDLTHVGQKMDFFELAGALWSHSPKMIEVMKEQDIPMPILGPEETGKLMAYLYYLGFFDELGNDLEGEEIYQSKGCAQCHSLGSPESTKRVPLDQYGRYASPLFMVTALWNHSSKISEAMAEKTFAPREMSHLLAFIQERALNQSGEKIYIQPGNPREGREVFQDKKCYVCHEGKSLSLRQSHLRRSLTEIVGMMWSHSYQMWSEMREMGLSVPVFSNEEMADLMSYLYFIQYYGEDASQEEGKNIFVQKGCASCHSEEAVEQNRGIDLAAVSGYTVFELISAMWNHVSEMEKMVTELNLSWPRFEKDEMKNLITYIQSMD